MEKMPLLKHEAGKALVTEAGLYRWLGWALDVMDSYELRLMQLGDPEELVRSETHQRIKLEIRRVLAPHCRPCQEGHTPKQTRNGYWWHEYEGDEPEPCMAGNLNEPA